MDSFANINFLATLKEMCYSWKVLEEGYIMSRYEL